MKISTDWVREEAQNLVQNAVVIDTETTGLGENDTIVELAAVRAFDRLVVFDSLVQPLSPVHPAAAAVHGIDPLKAYMQGTPADLAVSQMLVSIDDSSCTSITSYNLNFDRRLIEQSLLKKQSSNLGTILAPFIFMTNCNCIMELANRFFHEHLEWNADRSQFKRLSLERCLEIAGIKREGTAHRALSDALAATDLLRFIAGD